MKNLVIRNEEKSDYATVENITREAFWNIYMPGCDEHYLVHIMREHEDFISELDLVAQWQGEVVGNIMYTKAKLIDEEGIEKDVLTFGPLTVQPGFQRRGIGRSLIEHSFEKALAMGYDTVIIYGNPYNYVSRGFKSCKIYNICVENDIFPTALLVKELKPNALEGKKWYYQDSQIYKFDQVEAQEFDKLLEPKEKQFQPSQEEFYIYSHSVIQ